MSENQRDPQYKLRWSEDLRDKVAESAKRHNRSMNADIVARLEQTFRTFPSLSSERELHHIPTEELISEVMRRYDDAELVLSLERKTFGE